MDKALDSGSNDKGSIPFLLDFGADLVSTTKNIKFCVFFLFKTIIAIRNLFNFKPTFAFA